MANSALLVVVLGVAAAVIFVMAVALGRANAGLRTHMTRLEEQNREVVARQQDAETLATELEAASVELETAMEDANAARDEALANEERVRLLDETGRVLSSSLDYETTIAAVARLAVPRFADWCAVDVVVDGEIKQLAVAHVDESKVKWARELTDRYPVNPNDTTGVPQVIRSGEPQLIREVTDDMLVASALDEEHLRLLREVGIHSVVVVPITARGQTLGAITLVSSNPAHLFNEADVSLMLQLARRSGMAIDNARLYRAALAANESKSNFLATMSHELRTPLTAIIGYEELLAEGIPGNVNEGQRQQLHRIKASAMHLLSLIDEILLYARVEAGRESVRMEPVVAKGVVDDAIAFVAPQARERSLALTIDGVDPSLMLRTDAGKLRQMLVNLLANAVKFTIRGGVTVRAASQNGRVTFEVQDTGIGIAPEHIDHIFDPFWQVDQHTTRKAGGSGLGLSVTRRLARLLGGDVSVRSVPREGTTFTIDLPKDGVSVSDEPPRSP